MRPLGSGPLGIGHWALVIGIVIGSLAVGCCHCATGKSKNDELICNGVGIGAGPFEGTIVHRSTRPMPLGLGSAVALKHWRCHLGVIAKTSTIGTGPT